jgi:hypothetical protein
LLAAIALFAALAWGATLPSAAKPADPKPGKTPQSHALRGTLDRPGAPQRAIGPDAYGYIVSDSSEPNGPAYNYIAASQIITDFNGDDVAMVITAPFAINLYGRTSTNLSVNTNGLITFLPTTCGSTAQTPCFQNYPVPSLSAPPDVIAPFWDDLVISDTAGSGIYTETRGIAPARSFVVEWRNVNFYLDDVDSLTFQVIFHENSNMIEFEYANLVGDRSTGNSATVGIQNTTQTIGAQYSFEETALTSNTAVRFMALLSPGYQSDFSTCGPVVYTGTLINASGTTASYNLSTTNSVAGYTSSVAPTGTGPLAAGAQVPFTVTVNVPTGTAAGLVNVTRLTATSVGLPRPLAETVSLTTSPGAEFDPPTSSLIGSAGDTLVYTASLYNRSGTTTSFALSAGSTMWPVNITPANSGSMAPDASVPITVSFTIPANAQAGASDTAIITATASLGGGCQVFATAQFTVYNGNSVSRGRMPEGRARHAQVDFPANGRVYLLGGVNPVGSGDLPIEEYDPRADTWTPRSNLLRPVINVQAVTLGNLIYLPGGFDGINASTLLQTYDPLIDRASLVADDPVPAARYGAGVTTLNGLLYVIGGSDNVTSTQTVFVYDPSAPSGSRWTRRADMPTPRVAFSAVTVNGLIYAIGGIRSYNNPQDLTTVEVYDPATDSWTSAPSLLAARGGAAAVGLNTGSPCGGSIYEFGGGWYTPLATTERYDVAAGSWTQSTPLLAGRRSLAASYADNGHLLLITGGFGGNGVVSNLVDAINCGGSLPAPTPTPVGGIPTPTPIPCAGVFSDVNPTDYFYRPVSYLVCHGAVGGYTDGTFRPYNLMSRGQLSKVIVLGEGWAIDTSGGPHFSDVPADSTFYAYIETAVNHGIIGGYSDGTFHPSDNVSRGQIAKIIVGAQGWPLLSRGTQHFSDVPPASTFYAYIETAYAHALISGYADGTFRPSNAATRGQVSKMIYLALTNP